MDDPGTIDALFVDDEPKMLAGLLRGITRKRPTWSLRFAIGGDAALQLLADRPADVVVSDLRMAGMDGIALLDVVKQRFPQTARIILSGSFDKDALYRSLDCAHQFLIKPCDLDGLLGAIEQGRHAQCNIDLETRRSLLRGVSALPQLSSTYKHLVEVLDSPDSSLGDVSAVLAGDLGASAQLLRLVNSAMFGVADVVSDIHGAVRLLGIETVKSVVLSHGLFTQDACLAPWLDLDLLAEHSHEVAGVARWVGQMDAASAAEQAELFTASVLHDVGLLLMAATTTESPPPPGSPTAAGASAGAGAPDPPDLDAELEAYGAHRYAIAAYFLTVWGFPAAIVKAITQLHTMSPPEERQAWRLWAAHALVVRGGFRRDDLPGPGQPASRELLRALDDLRPHADRRVA